jgi:hypothetical protein
MEKPPAPVEIFYSFVEVDAPFLEQLEHHLSILRHEGTIKTWHKHQIIGGRKWQMELDYYLNTASLILLLISSDFLASDYQYGVELQRAIDRHNENEARVIPILLRSCDWKGASFAKLQMIPRNGEAVTSWRNRDEAWTDVAQGIREAIEELQNSNVKKELLGPKTSQLIRAQKKSIRLDPFPPVWNIPYRYTPFFTGRDQVVEELFRNFITAPASGIIPIQALTGLGGLGKTQTAVAYAFRYRKQYQSVLWIKAETEEDLVTGFTSIAKLLALPDTNLQQRESVLESIQRWLSDVTDWLLIFDNVVNLTLIEAFLPRKLLNGHILLTTRAIAMNGLAQPLVLHPLEPKDGALCILRRANYIGWNADLTNPSVSASARSAALNLSELMGGLPLALEQAGAYIETTGRGVSGYLKLYEKYRSEIQKNQYGDILYYRTAVAFTWNIAREIVQQENPAAIELLYLCAYLAPNAIPYQLFSNDVRILGPTLGPVAANELALDQALALLRRHSLIKNEVDHDTDVPRIFLHRVLQEVLRDAMDAETQRLWAERAVYIVAHALPPVVEWQIIQAHVRSCISLIEQWNMSFHEADLIRKCFATCVANK